MRKDVNEIVEQIGELVKGIWSQSENPQGLSKALNDIAVLNWALALWQAEYEEQERMMKAELDLAKAEQMERLTSTTDPTTEKPYAVNRAEIRVMIATTEMRKDYNKVASLLEKIKIMARANDRVMEAARSRLSLIKKDI